MFRFVAVFHGANSGDNITTSKKPLIRKGLCFIIS